jgi:hypothetical protein
MAVFFTADTHFGHGGARRRPANRSRSDCSPSSVSKTYSLPMRTHGNCCRRRASSSLRRVSSLLGLEDAGHYLQEDARELIVPELLRFLATLPDAWAGANYSTVLFDLSEPFYEVGDRFSAAHKSVLCRLRRQPLE